jgi:hypothetical protein
MPRSQEPPLLIDINVEVASRSGTRDRRSTKGSRAGAIRLLFRMSCDPKRTGWLAESKRADFRRTSQTVLKWRPPPCTRAPTTPHARMPNLIPEAERIRDVSAYIVEGIHAHDRGGIDHVRQPIAMHQRIGARPMVRPILQWHRNQPRLFRGKWRILLAESIRKVIFGRRELAQVLSPRLLLC